ncbi:MAG: class I SAM-dependent methyltransferase [Amylibacter sp.]|jgi:SAM-dependent methyltransferase|nr:class I SAM-dependent methyltransferase [Amylibacter sp.]
MTQCNVCGEALGAPIYKSGSTVSLTTMNALIEGETTLHFCETCGHTQTTALDDLERYYAQDYEINIDGDDDDQLYGVVDGAEVYRSDHQANVLMQKVDLSKFSKVLDYGCAKAATLRKVRLNTPEVSSYLFDVTDKYVPFWEKFPDPKEYASFQPDASWNGSIDVLLSFYALEHTPKLHEALSNVKNLLRTGGIFYFLVPNMYENAADFIVADHVNHFSKSSLTWLLESHGFEDIEIDETAHTAAFVVLAKLSASGDSECSKSDVADIKASKAKVVALAQLWGGIVERVHQFEDEFSDEHPCAIYGAGIYGNFIYSCLKNPQRISRFIDQNKYLVGKEIHGIPVVPPTQEVPNDIAVFVGLNPKSARSIMDTINVFEGKSPRFFFVE